MVLNMTFLWFSVPGPANSCDCHCDPIRGTQTTTEQVTPIVSQSGPPLNSTVIAHTTVTPVITQAMRDMEHHEWGPHQLAVVVPFRNRYDEMMEFVPHIHSFLTRQRVRHQIWVIDQADKHRYTHMCMCNGVIKNNTGAKWEKLYYYIHNLMCISI